MKPNLRKYTVLEAADLRYRWMGLEEQGKHEEAKKVQLEIPILPGLANNLKQRYGIKVVIESGVNLSDAVKYYGIE